MPLEEKVNKLTEFCNNLGKGFRKLTEDTDNKVKKLESQIKVLQNKNKELEKEVNKVNKEELIEIIEDRIKKFHGSTIEHIDEEIKKIKETKVSNEGKIEDLDKKLNSLEVEQLSLTETVKQSEEKITVSADMIDDVKAKLNLAHLKYNKHNNPHSDNRENKLKCKLCEQVFYSQPILRCHIKTKHGKSMIKCNECGDVFDNKFNLEQHLLNVH